MLPIERYQADLAAKLIEPDSEQARVVGYLNDLFLQLQTESQRKASWLASVWQNLIGGSGTETTTAKGLYIWGGVGRGKTYLMDMFYDCLPVARKQRTHFYRFMQDIHKSLAKLQGESDPLRLVAQSIAAETDVLCFDEFFVSDIGDAMILGGLLEARFSLNVVLV
ncbi:MAG: cell division protein ZapE, partial [Pseudomonadales bacterium]|nr:cell division protein ZapE [Pseudomonadales bacterium]